MIGGIIMNWSFVKYSVFGRYEEIGTTPEQVSKIYEILGKKGFLPNMIQLIQVEQPSNVIKTVDRAQFVNKEKNHIITILPDRIDVQISSDSYEEVYEYFAELMQLFDLKANRLAINANCQMLQLNEEQLERIKNAFVVETEKEKNIEWSFRSVTRNKILDDKEIVNTVYQIQYSELLPQSKKNANI